MTEREPRGVLSADVVGLYERRLWQIPLWLVVVVLVLAALGIASDLVLGQPGRAVVPAVGGGLLLVVALRSRRRPPTISTEVSQDGLVVSSTGGKRDVVWWDHVAGVRVFRRYSRPQVVLTDGSPVQLLAVPDQVARSLAAQLPAVLGRPVWFEVDDHRTDPTTPSALTGEP